jgi:hypothetical protein
LPIGFCLSNEISSIWQINANKIDIACEFIVISINSDIVEGHKHVHLCFLPTLVMTNKQTEQNKKDEPF